MESNTSNLIDVKSLYARFQEIQDRRKARGKRYDLATILLCLFLAKLCGEDKPSGIAEWVRHREAWITQALNLKRGTLPSHNTYRRVLGHVISEDEFEELSCQLFAGYGQSGYRVVVSIDGKAVRGTIDPGKNPGLWLLAVYLPSANAPLAQMAIETKQNEISAAPKLLERVDLRNKVVIGDAMHTQRQVSIQIGTARGRFIWIVKGNHPQLEQDLKDWFDPKVVLLPGMGCPPKDFCTATTVTKGHGRIETRILTTSSQLNDFLDWPFLQQVFKLERQVTIRKTGKSRSEVVYGVTSLSSEEASPGELQTMLRSYWQIENGLHYRRDVTLHEDETRFSQNSAAHIMSIINNIVLGLIAEAGYKFAPVARRFFAAHPEAALRLFI